MFNVGSYFLKLFYGLLTTKVTKKFVYEDRFIKVFALIAGFVSQLKLAKIKSCKKTTKG